jgi:hypothetical protein
MSETRWEEQTSLTPQPEEPAPRTEEPPAPAASDSGTEWQAYSPEILCPVLDS